LRRWEEYFPLTEKDILEKGFSFKSEKNKTIYSWEKVQVPNNISDINRDILKKILTCETCNKNYRLVEPEFNFYKKQNLPVPVKCPSCRHLDRRELRA